VHPVRAGRRKYLSRHQLADLTLHTIPDTRVLERRLSESDDVFNDREEYRLGTSCVAATVEQREAAVAAAGDAGARVLSRPVVSLSEIPPVVRRPDPGEKGLRSQREVRWKRGIGTAW